MANRQPAAGSRLAEALGVPLIEGDCFHPAGNIDKMQRGVPLHDHDRAGWLALLGEELVRHAAGSVLTCSALKRSYRDSLRAAVPGLRFVHLALSEQDALGRVSGRADHFYPPSLVASQFEALEDPVGEPGVIALDALLPLAVVTGQALHWLASGFNNP